MGASHLGCVSLFFFMKYRENLTVLKSNISLLIDSCDNIRKEADNEDVKNDALDILNQLRELDQQIKHLEETETAEVALNEGIKHLAEIKNWGSEEIVNKITEDVEDEINEFSSS